MRQTSSNFCASLTLLVAIACLSGCSFFPPGGISTVVASNKSDGTIALQCQASSTGICYFRLGEAFDSIHDLKVGESKAIPSPSSTIPVCATNTLSYRLHCTTMTTIGPGSLVTYKWVSSF